MLNLYRRHRRDCSAGHPEDSSSGEFEERKKGWKRCECPIFTSGTLARKFRRQSTNQWEWTPAKTLATQWEIAGNWKATPQTITAVPPQPELNSGVLLDRAVKAFLAAHAETSSASTQRMYRYFMNQFRTHSESLGFVVLNQWGPMEVREFRTSWGVAHSTATKNMTILKSFFEFAVSNEWIERNPARLVKEARGHKDKNQNERTPFSDDELKRMFLACENQYGKKNGEESWRYRWNGQDLADFISISVYTGLRISDVCTFHSDRLLDSGECHIRTTKTGKKVYTWIPTWLQQRIRERTKKYGPFVFGTHGTNDMSVVTDVWRRKLLRLWALCGPWPEKPSPHRFRHTFARILLQKQGVTVRDVADLLGNTEDIVRKHYSAWVSERQAHLTKVLREAFEDRPTPKLVEMQKRS